MLTLNLEISLPVLSHAGIKGVSHFALPPLPPPPWVLLYVTLDDLEFTILPFSAFQELGIKGTHYDTQIRILSLKIFCSGKIKWLKTKLTDYRKKK